MRPQRQLPHRRQFLRRHPDRLRIAPSSSRSATSDSVPLTSAISACLPPRTHRGANPRAPTSTDSCSPGHLPLATCRLVLFTRHSSLVTRHSSLLPPLATRSRQSNPSSAAASAALITRSSCPRPGRHRPAQQLARPRQRLVASSPPVAPRKRVSRAPPSSAYSLYRPPSISARKSQPSALLLAAVKTNGITGIARPARRSPSAAARNEASPAPTPVASTTTTLARQTSRARSTSCACSAVCRTPVHAIRSTTR